MSAEAVEAVESEPLLLTTQDLIHPSDRRFWLDDDMFFTDKRGLPIPRFSVQEVSKCFFGKGPDWLRWRSRADTKGKHPEGFFVLDGEPLPVKRLPNKGKNDTTARYYTLADVERMAHALAQHGAIDGGELANIVLMVKTCARIYGVL